MRGLIAELQRIFGPLGIDVQFISWSEMQQRLTSLIEEHSADRPPIITLDPVYVEGADMMFSTNRLTGFSKHSSTWTDLGKGPRPGSPMIDVQLAEMARHSSLGRSKRVIVVDDGVWTGGTLAALDQLFLVRGIRVDKFLVALQIRQEEESHELRGIEDRIIAHRDGDFAPGEVIDYVCERDFYVGVPYSGRTLGVSVSANGASGPKSAIQIYYPNLPMPGNFGAPYVAPLGDPEHWASIPSPEVKAFSRACLMLSRRLYVEVEKETKRRIGHARPVLVKDLDRPPFLYKKPDWHVIHEIDISLDKLG